MARRPNIVFFVFDDLGTGDAGCYGHPSIRTPGVDALAAEGVRFSHAFCTTASCSASRATLMTGRYNHAIGHYGHAHDFHHFSTYDGVPSLPNLLGAEGYRTMIAGKCHLAPEPVYHFAQTLNLDYRDGLSPVQMADAVRPLLAAETEAPFFLYFCTIEPHRPFWREGSDPVAPADVVVPRYLPDTPECRDELAQYCMSAQRGDRGLLRLIELLKETGHWEDTVILALSDNGIAFPGAKTTLYEPAMRLPCVMRVPGETRPNSVCEAMINWADVAPTLLDCAGFTPARIAAELAPHGRSFRACLPEADPPGWDQVHASHTFHEITMYYPMRVVRTRRHKLIWNIAHQLEYPFASDLWESSTWQGILRRGDEWFGPRRVADYLHRPAFELYDLQADPDEVYNLAGDPAHADLLAQMQGQLRHFQQATADPWIVKWQHE